MALDVRLSRDVDEPWGFQLKGGVEREMPLSVKQIEADSPAKRGGLLVGDTILTINREEAIDMTLETACRRLEDCGTSLTVGVMRGLYDPVLDDHEPIYDYEPEDLDPQSEPTEVPFEVQRFVEPEDLGSNLLDISPPPFTNGLTESRSLTASPFVTLNKPYRPFSTEPIPPEEVPPLEDPIILNPKYRDEFGKSPKDIDPDYLINSYCKELNGFAGGFKLPISDQYDPDGTRFKQSVEVIDKLLKYEKQVKSLSKDLSVVDVTKETRVCDVVDTSVDIKTKESLTKDVKVTESFKKDIKREDVKISEGISSKDVMFKESIHETEKKEIFREDVEEQSIKEELKYIEKMRQEIDLDKIEKTALSVVEDSIERAVSVAEEIKKEIEIELSSSEEVSEIKTKDSKSVKSEMRQESSEMVNFETRVCKESNLEGIERKIEKREQRYDFVDESSQKVSKKDHREVREELSETVVMEDVKVAVDKNSLVSEDHEEYIVKPTTKESEVQGIYENKSEFAKATKTVTSGVKNEKEAESRAFKIGLQTIPNIRGVVHSSYHFDLLLRTFFLHLTDVMVALSRFLLSQPIFSQLEGASKTCVCGAQSSIAQRSEVRKTSQETFTAQKVEKQRAEEAKGKFETKQKIVETVPMKPVSQKIEKDLKIESVQEKKVEKKKIVQPVVKEVKQEQVKKVEEIEAKQEQKIEKAEVKAVETIEKKAVTGSEMAQLSEKKLSKDLTQKMDAVISEFQTVAVEDVTKEAIQRNRRSRSRSQIEEEVMKEGDPLEWLSKVDSKKTSQERTEISKKEISSAETTEKVSKVESRQETLQETRHKKSKSPKQTYLAIVESHVYTNKDAIFEEQATDFSETSSIQSAEEINTAFEAIEAVSTENVALENAIKELESAKIVEESQELATVAAQSTAAVKVVEEKTHESKKIVKQEYKKETAIQSSDIQNILMQETQEIIEPVVEFKETKKEENVAIDINQTLSIAESTEIRIQESKSEFTNVEMKSESLAIVEEERTMEKVSETKPKVIEPKPVQTEQITETVKVKPNKKDVKPVTDEYAAIKIIKKVEMEGNLSPEVIEVQDISELAAKKTITTETASLQGTDLSIVSGKTLISSGIKMATTEASSHVNITKLTEKSSISADVSSARSEAKSVVDLSQVSQVSSTISSTNAMEVSQSSNLEEILKESSFTAKSVDKKLTLRTDLERETSIQSPPSTINTPTPGTVPPTPLTDEYVFKLSLPLPKSRGNTPIPRDCTLSPEDEDPHIVKKKLIPHIDTTIERVVYDTPLPTPPADKPQSPVYTKPGLNGGGRVRFPVYRKPGLFGGADRPDYAKEEIREIERKSSLLASAIDETIKSIEEYKEEVGIDTKKEVKTEEFKEEKISNSYHEFYSKKVTTETVQNGFEEIDTKIEEIMEQCDALAGINNIEDPIPSIEEVPDDVEVKIDQESIPIEVNTHITKHDEEKRVKFASVIKEFSEKVNNYEENNTDDKPSTIINIVESPKESTPDQFPETQVEATAVIVQPTVNIKIDTENKENFKTEKNIYENVIQKENNETIFYGNVETAKTQRLEEKTDTSDALPGFRPVVFDPEAIQKRGNLPSYMIQAPTIQEPWHSPYMTPSGEIIGTTQGIVDGLEEPVMDAEVAKELGKPGISEEKIAEIMSGEAEMLREAHVMGLSRVLTSHMHRADDSSVDFQKIKPLIDSLKDSEVLKALNEELARQREEERKKEEKKWTTFMQKPKRPVPRVKFGYHGWTQEEEEVPTEPYKVKIIKQAKPKVAPDYKPEDFNTGPLPWEERALKEPVPPVEPEEPILIPEVPEFLEAVDPLKESEVPDLEDTGIPLPPPRDPTPPPTVEETPEPEPVEEAEVAELPEVIEEEEKKETREDMENRLAEQLVRSVQGMVDPNASVEQQLSQMRAQLAALAQLPEVIQQTLELVSKQLNKMTKQDSLVVMSASHTENDQQMEVSQNHNEMQTIQEGNENTEGTKNDTQQEVEQNEIGKVTIEEIEDKVETENVVQEEQKRVEEKRREQECRKLITPVPTEEDLRTEKQKKEAQLAHEARQVKQHPTPRVGKPKRVFGPLDPEERPVVLPGGRRWRKTEDVYNEQMFAETLQAQAELIQGKALGFESDLLPYDNRINFMKYEKPPVSLDHLKHSEVYKLVHDMDQPPLKRVEMRTPAIAEADYRERCRSMTPAPKHMQIPQQFHP